MMSLVARQELMRYSSGMTELSTLEYGATLAPLIHLVTLLWAWIGNKDFGKRLRQQLQTASKLAWLPVGVLFALAYLLLGMLRPVAKGILWLGWAWMELWHVRPIAEVLYDWLEEVRYQEHRLAYVGKYRA